MFLAHSAPTRRRALPRWIAFLLAFLLAAGGALPAPAKKQVPSRAPAKKPAAQNGAATARKTPTAKSAKRRPVKRVYPGRWTEPTFADSTVGDVIDGEELVVRRAAVEALGAYNGTVVAVDSTSGRVLTMVNQKVALTSGFIPCSTVKVAVGLAALSEGIVERDTPLRLTRRSTISLTEALAHSNNPYFARLGEKLGRNHWCALSARVEEAAVAEFAARGKTTIKPNVDFFSAPVYHLMGIPHDLMTPLFAVSRVAGWTAHIIEEKFGDAQGKPALYRPSSDYTGNYCGKTGCVYRPIGERKG